MATSRTLRTRARILDAALDLFERQGYDATTVNQVAEAAGVTPMTFFRHFATKDAVLVTDPYDPLIAEAVGDQPGHLPPLERTRRGLLAALGDITPTEDATARRRVALVARSPSLRAAVAVGTEATQDAIVERLVADGTDRLDAAIAAAACLAATTAALLAWGTAPDDVTLAQLVRRALAHLAPAGAPS
ncbi:TetR/AcrR family transcriptional regulator [Antribacter gilvus]|uniref:TetR/AcrR family transcriptional regulator n=1 Tax=Antribacter gilvus TaxID=2304675 RepID=UPI00197FD234|nr:TetR/AcrR family transcriptional regulator [Antribacter gilvus]